MDEFFLSVNHVALMLKVHPLTIRRYIREGRLKAVKVGGSVRIPQSALEHFTQDASPTSPTAKKMAKTAQRKLFNHDDPIFRLQSAGVHLKQFE